MELNLVDQVNFGSIGPNGCADAAALGRPQARIFQFPEPGIEDCRANDGLGCAKAVRLAIALEFAAGLITYGIFRLFH